MSQLTSEQAAVIVVLAHHEAKKRIPQPQRPGTTFFSMWDTWLFQAVQDHKTCDLCNHYETAKDWRGDQLRSEFPYLEIMDENTVKANVHPNCRCYLVRKIGYEEPVELPAKEPFYWFNSQGEDVSPEDRKKYLDRVKEVINELPKEHTEGIDEISVVHEFSGSPNTAGRYRRVPL